MPRTQQQKPQQQTQKQTTQQSNGVQRLDLKDVSVDKKRCRLLWAGDPKEAQVNADWATLSIKIQSVANGAKRMYTMSDNNPVLKCLDAAFGEKWEENPATYKDREVMIWKAVVGVLEKQYIRFSVLDKDGKEIPFDYDNIESSGSSSSHSDSL